MAEAAACRAGLRSALEKKPWRDHDVPARALAHLDREDPTETAAAAVRTSPEDTETELRDLAESEAMVERALAILRKGKAGAYSKALAALSEETLEEWSEAPTGTHRDQDDDEAGDPDPYQPDAPSLERFLNDEIVPWHQQRRRELQNRNLIRSQAFGESLEPDRLDKLARYEVHLDRKLERILGMLLKLQDLRRTITPDPRRLNPFRKSTPTARGCEWRQRPNREFESPSLRQSPHLGHSFPSSRQRPERRRMPAFPLIYPNHGDGLRSPFWAISCLSSPPFSDATEPRPFWYGCEKPARSMGYAMPAGLRVRKCCAQAK